MLPIRIEPGSADGTTHVVLDGVALTFMRMGPLIDSHLTTGMPVDRGLALLTSSAAALAGMHSMGVVHGDVRPHTIFLSPDGRALLSGETVPLVAAGLLVPDARFAAPEVAVTGLTMASDVWALGVVGFVALLGALPGSHPFFSDATRSESWDRAAVTIAPAEAVARLPDPSTADLRKLLALMLSPAAQERPSAADVANSLNSLGRGGGLQLTATVPAASIVRLERDAILFVTAEGHRWEGTTVENLGMVVGAWLSLPPRHLDRHISLATIDFSRDFRTARLVLLSQLALTRAQHACSSGSGRLFLPNGQAVVASFTPPGTDAFVRADLRATDDARTRLTILLSSSGAAGGAGAVSALGSEVARGGAGGGGLLDVSFDRDASGGVAVSMRTSTAVVYSGSIATLAYAGKVNVRVPSGVGASALESEMRPIMGLGHSHMVRVFGITRVPKTTLPEEYGVVMERCPVSVGAVLRDLAAGDVAKPGVAQAVDVKARLGWAVQVADALVYLHASKYYHTNIKPDNIGWDPVSGIAKIADVTPMLPESVAVMSRGMRGSPMYMCPALASGTACVTEKTDVYSWGVTLWELITLRSPYKDLVVSSVNDFFDHVRRGRRPGDMDEITRSTSAAVAELIARCWDSNPESRPTMAAARTALATALIAPFASGK